MRYIDLRFLILLMVVLISCEKELLYRIGQEHEGGIIFDIGSSGKHGLIAAPYDQSDSAEWGCTTAKIAGADGTVVGTGRQNTLDIVNSCNSPDIAARICNDLILNGYDDWFLPSKDELNLMYLRKEIIGNFAVGLCTPYWSSSEYEIHFAAWRQDISNGEQTIYDKYNTYHVRAIRAF